MLTNIVLFLDSSEKENRPISPAAASLSTQEEGALKDAVDSDDDSGSEGTTCHIRRTDFIPPLTTSYGYVLLFAVRMNRLCTSLMYSCFPLLPVVVRLLVTSSSSSSYWVVDGFGSGNTFKNNKRGNKRNKRKKSFGRKGRAASGSKPSKG